MTSTEQDQRPWRAPFFSIWGGQQLSLVGSSLAQFALVWWLTDTTGSATVLATGTLISLLPNVLLGPLVGALVDRWKRRKVMIVADGVIALASAWLVFLFWSGAIDVRHVYVIMLVRAIGGTFHWPAMQASTSLMVPERHLSRVSGLNQTMQGALSVVSPPLGALLLGVLPLYAIMAIDVGTAAFAIGPLLFVSVPQPLRRGEGGAAGGAVASLWADVREGLGYIWHWPGLMTVMAMAAMVNFFLWPAFSLVPILVTQHFGGGPVQLAWMNSAFGVGLVLGGLTLGVWGGFRRRVVTSLVGLTGMGVGTLLVGLAPTAAFGLATGGLFATAFMMAITNGPIFALFQAIVDPEMQARVFTVVGSMSAAMSPLGMAVGGPASDAWGIRIWYLMGGVACILMGVTAFFIPAVMHLDDRRPAAVATETVAVG